MTEHSPTNATLKALGELLQHGLQEHIDSFQNPILIALQGCGLSVLEAAIIWIDLEEQVSKAYSNTLENNSPTEAQYVAEETRRQLAAQIVAARSE